MAEKRKHESKHIKRKKEETNIKYDEMDSNTPPLPSKMHLDINELVKKRETLKKELKKLQNHSDSALIIKSPYDSKKIYFRKRISDNSDKNKQHRPAYESSPEIPEHSATDSDDELHIIEQRRKQRKQLLEKLRVDSNTNQKIQNEVTDKLEESKSQETETGNETSDVSRKESIQEITDMFSEKDTFIKQKESSETVSDNNNELRPDEWDDVDSFYIIRPGDQIDNERYNIKSVLGQGTFANVVQAYDKTEYTNVAIKIIRNNDLTYYSGLKEIGMLKEISDADPENRHHCVKLLRYFMHKNHLCIVLEPLFMDLRSVINKYGKRHGINMKAVISYSRQLLLALRLLKKIGIIHADLKPDNILVNEKKNVLKLCDFGTAEKIGDGEIKSYLVSRFYRAPEIILGISYGHGVDVWSAACTIYEIATGKIMFTGSSNNKMLKCFMDLKGKIPTRIVKKGKYKDQHFNYNYNFLYRKKDEVSGRERYTEVTNVTPTRNLQEELKRSFKDISPKDHKKMIQLRELIEKMLNYDQQMRPTATDCLKQQFIQEQYHS